MADIRSLGVLAQLRSDASSHVIRYRNGRIARSGRGLVFWFNPETASIADVTPVSHPGRTGVGG